MRIIVQDEGRRPKQPRRLIYHIAARNFVISGRSGLPNPATINKLPSWTIEATLSQDQLDYIHTDSSASIRLKSFMDLVFCTRPRFEAFLRLGMAHSSIHIDLDEGLD